MPPPNDRPKWIDDLMLALGAEMGLEGLSFPESGVIELDFSGTELGLFLVPPTPVADASILIKSVLDLPLHLPVPVLALLLETNLSTFAAGRGFVACDTEFGFWVWTDRIDLAGVRPQHFRARLEQAANAARDWAARCPDLLKQASAGDTSDEIQPQPDDDSVFFRL